ncbi:DNA-directed RNA polymerase subunit alpha [Candidatus Fermentibacterales bacterium]|nr:DNA-directed RNA polymerase subunit alpha [Candidatus Fermentibacterales bacterium]
MDIRKLHLPDIIQWDEADASDRFGRLVVSALERGFGRTLGNSLRRVLLSSLNGAAPVSVNIEGALHEFTALPGVMQDVPDILLNVKSLDVVFESGEEEGPGSGESEAALMSIDVEGPASVTAGDLQLDEGLRIVDTSLPIADVAEGGHLRMQISVETGRGYLTVDDWLKMGRGKDIGEILLDSWFGPVRKVNYKVESARVGDRTDFDRLVMEITTNGTMTPREAVEKACGILVRHLRLITGEETPGAVPEAVAEEAVEEESEDLALDKTGLSPRLVNCLAAGGIHTLHDLTSRTGKDLLSLRNFGQASLQSLMEMLDERGLSLRDSE